MKQKSAVQIKCDIITARQTFGHFNCLTIKETNMKHAISMTLAGASLMLFQACENLTPEQRTVVGVGA